MHISQCLLSSHVCPSFSHCYLPLPAGEEEDSRGGRSEGRGHKAEAVKEEEKEAPKKTNKAEGKKAMAESIVLPLDDDGLPVDPAGCTGHDHRGRSGKEAQTHQTRLTSEYSGILHVGYRIIGRILNTMKNTVFFRVFCADSARYS